MVQVQDCKVDVATLFKICDGLCGANICVWLSILIKKKHFRNISCGTNSIHHAPVAAD
jgi:hypothetical protein